VDGEAVVGDRTGGDRVQMRAGPRAGAVIVDREDPMPSPASSRQARGTLRRGLQPQVSSTQTGTHASLGMLVAIMVDDAEASSGLLTAPVRAVPAPRLSWC
jgi:hypothetical protein